jgi:uncharacterized protein YpiB (UPF0302 family)
MSTNIDALYQAVEDYLTDESLGTKQKERLQKMLDEKIDVKSFFVWLLEEYPLSAKIAKKDFAYISNHF